MTVYLLSYDLVNERGSHDYKPLWGALATAGAHRTQLSTWLVSSTSSVQAVHDHFQRYLDKDDRLWVTRVPPAQNWYSNAMAGTNDWLKRNRRADPTGASAERAPLIMHLDAEQSCDGSYDLDLHGFSPLLSQVY